MAGVQADAVIVDVIARVDQFERNMKRAADVADREMSRIRKAAASPVSIGGGAEREATTVERAATRKVNAAKREAEAENDKAARISAAVDRGIAARERDAQSAERSAERVRRAGSRSTVSNQSRLMAGTSLGAVSPAPVEDKVNYLLRDQIDLRTRLGAAIAAGEAASVTALNDQITLLRLIDQYKRAGLSETAAAERAEAGLASVVKARADAEARGAAAQDENAKKGVAGVGRVANGYRNLGRQISDVGTSVAGGLSPFLIIAQQAPQVADALVDTGGKAAKVAAFFAGPWGAALLAAGSVIAVMASKALEGGETIQGLTKDLRENEAKARLSAEAEKIFANSLDGLAKSAREARDALKEKNRTQLETLQLDYAQSEGRLTKELKEQAKAQKELRDALKSRKDVEARASSDPEAGGAALAVADRRVRDAQAKVTLANRAVTDERVALAQARIPILNYQAEATDAITAATQKQERAVRDLRIAYERATEAANKLNDPKKQQAAIDAAAHVYRIGVQQANQRADAEKQAAQAAEAAARRTDRAPSAIGRTVNVTEATQIIQGIGGRVTSGYRSTAEQSRIYADKLAGRHVGPVARPGTSAHERGNAIDVAFGRGISVQSIRDAFRDAGVAIRKILPEPTQRVFHVEFGKAGKSAEAIARATKVAADRQVRDDEAFFSQRESLRQSQLDAVRDNTTDISELANLSREDVLSATRARAAQIERDRKTGKYDQAQADELNQLNQTNAILQTSNIGLREQEQLQAKALETQRAIFASTDAQLSAQLELADTQAERKRIEKQILDNRLKEAQASAAAVFVNPRATQAERDQAGRDLGDAVARNTAGNKSIDRNYESPYDRYRRQLSDTDSLANDLSQFKVDTLEGITNELTDATKAALGLKGAFGDIVGELIRIGIQRKLIGPLADSLFGKSDGSSSGALGSLISSIGNAFSGGRASGGDVSAGRLYKINENGVEGFQPAMSGKIIPLGRMQAASTGQTIVIAPQQFDLSNAVMTPELVRQMDARNRQYADAVSARAGQAAYNNSPGRSRKLQQLGS